MRFILPTLLLLLAAASPADARNRNSDRIYTTTYGSRCGTVGCVARHERAIRVGPRERGFRERSFRSYGSRSRY